MRESNDPTGSNITRALAAASTTPFRTAFKITMGIALANLLTLAFVLGGIATVIFLVALYLGKVS